MIGGLQGEFGDLDIKYLKQNISKYLNCQSHISGSFRRTPRHCAKWLRNSPGKRYQRIRICLTGEVETPSSPIRRQAPDVKYPDGMSAENIFGCEISGWNVDGAEFRMWDIRVECRWSRIPDVRHPGKVDALPYPNSLRKKHTALVNITLGQ